MFHPCVKQTHANSKLAVLAYVLHAKIINIIMIQSQWNVCCVIVSGALHNQLRMVAWARPVA